SRMSDLIGAYDAATASEHIIRVIDDSVCADSLDLGFAAGKVSFSYDGASVAFSSSRINVDAQGDLVKPDELFYRDAFLLDMQTGRLIALSHNRSIFGNTFPEFLPDGSAVLLDWLNRARPTTAIRLVALRR